PNQQPALRSQLVATGVCDQILSSPEVASAGLAENPRFLQLPGSPRLAPNPASLRWMAAFPCSSREAHGPVRQAGPSLSGSYSCCAQQEFPSPFLPLDIRSAGRNIACAADLQDAVLRWN